MVARPPQKEKNAMKNRRAIFFLIFWNAVFAAAIAFLSLPSSSAREPVGLTLSSMDVREIESVEIDRASVSGGRRETVSIARENGIWWLKSPVVAVADDESVKRLIDAVVFARPSHSLSEKDMADMGRSPRDFSLAVPLCSVMISDGERGETIRIGRKTAAGDELYVSRDGRAGVFTVPAALAAELSRPVADFRRRRLFAIGADAVAGVALKDAGETLTRIAKTDGQWRIVNPIEAPADRKMVEELIGDLCSAHVIDYSEAAVAGHGLGDGEGFSISLRDTFGSVEKIVFGAADGTNAVWAVTSEGAVVRVASELPGRCRDRKKPLEDTRAFPVEASAVTSFSVSKDFPAYVLSRQGVTGPWLMVSPLDALADAEVADRCLAGLLSLRGVDLADGAGEGAVMVSVGTQSTNFTARYVSSSALLQDMRMEDLLGKTVVKCCRERIRRIVVKTATGEEWNAALSDETLRLFEAGVMAKRVEKVVIRPDDFQRFGFDRPAYTISLELNDDASSMRRMLIGAVSSDGGRYAVIGGSDAAFVLPASTVSVLSKPMDEKMEDKR
jgi:hypothetical protein